MIMFRYPADRGTVSQCSSKPGEEVVVQTDVAHVFSLLITNITLFNRFSRSEHRWNHWRPFLFQTIFWGGKTLPSIFCSFKIILPHFQDLVCLTIIIIMEICKRPTYQNILTAQGAYISKNSDNILQQKQQKVYQKYTFTYFIAHTHTHARTHARTHAAHTHANRHACSMYTSIQASQQKM